MEFKSTSQHDAVISDPHRRPFLCSRMKISGFENIVSSHSVPEEGDSVSLDHFPPTAVSVIQAFEISARTLNITIGPSVISDYLEFCVS